MPCDCKLSIAIQNGKCLINHLKRPLYKIVYRTVVQSYKQLAQSKHCHSVYYEGLKQTFCIDEHILDLCAGSPNKRVKPNFTQHRTV